MPKRTRQLRFGRPQLVEAMPVDLARARPLHKTISTILAHRLGKILSLSTSQDNTSEGQRPTIKCRHAYRAVYTVNCVGFRQKFRTQRAWNFRRNPTQFTV